VGLAGDVVEVLLEETGVVEVGRKGDVLILGIRRDGLRQVARPRVCRREGATGDEGAEPEARNLDRHPERCALHGRICFAESEVEARSTE
jgi:hypothetical protein